MKRYKQQFEWDEDYTTPARMDESPDGDWVRYEDADRELRGSAGSSYGPMSRIANALEALRGRR